MLQISHHGDRQPVHRPDLLADRVGVQQGLCRMLPNPVAGVDDRLLAVTRSGGNSARGWMPQNHHIRVAGQHLDTVLQAFTFLVGRLCLVRVDDATAETLHSRGKAASCARARLVEDAGHELALKDVADGSLLLDAGSVGVRQVEEEGERLLVKHAHLEHVAVYPAVTAAVVGR